MKNSLNVILKAGDIIEYQHKNDTGIKTITGVHANGMCRPQIYMDNGTELEIPTSGVSGEYLKSLGWIRLNNKEIIHSHNYNIDINHVIH